MTDITAMPIDEVELVKDLYPRLRPDDDAIERYRDALDQLPPIVVARGHILVDGYHRWQAHKREGRTDIPAEDLGNLSDAEIFNESIRRNASHGQQLSRKDKQALAGRLWGSLAHLGDDTVKGPDGKPVPSPGSRTAEIMALLAVSAKTVERATKDQRDAEREKLKTDVVGAWLDCAGSDREIADRFSIDHKTVAKWAGEYSTSVGNSPPESRQHFDVWQFQSTDRDGGGQQSYFGAIPPQVVENVLWFWTEPGGIVVDPFAGSGTTIDVAKRMGRRVWASDRRGNEYSPLLPIHRHDITTGWPEDAPKRADLILLDPPYWKQAEGRYSTDAEDLANGTLDEFNERWAAVVKTCATHLAQGGRLAYIISPTQDDGQVVDHATDMLRACWDAGLRVERRIVVPYNTQQASGQQVTWARESRRLLKLYRDLVVLS